MRSKGALCSARWRAAHKEEAARRAKASYYANRDELVAKKRAYNAARRAEINAKARARDRLNPEKKRARSKAYREQHREELRAKNRAYQQSHPAVVRAGAMRHIAARRQATPRWADHSEIAAIYREAVRLTQATGIEHQVDHIYPLNSPILCGLHVAANLQILTKTENLRKSNRLHLA